MAHTLAKKEVGVELNWEEKSAAIGIGGRVGIRVRFKDDTLKTLT